MGTFRIATFNVNSLRSRLHIVLPWLSRYEPHVFSMQETKVVDEKFPRREFEELGYRVFFRGVKQHSGVAVAVREDPREVSFGLSDDGPPDEERLICLKLPAVTIINTYIPQGRERDDPQFTYKLAWFRRFRKFLERFFTPQEPLIWCGDLNVAPENIDVHDPKRLLGHVCFTPEVWEVFSYVKAWGFYDVFRKHHPGETGQYTFFDYRVPKAVERKLGWRVDHILATEPLLKKSLHCTIDMGPRLAEKPSDHTILYADFAL